MALSVSTRMKINFTTALWRSAAQHACRRRAGLHLFSTQHRNRDRRNSFSCRRGSFSNRRRIRSVDPGLHYCCDEPGLLLYEAPLSLSVYSPLDAMCLVAFLTIASITSVLMSQ